MTTRKRTAPAKRSHPRDHATLLQIVGAQLTVQESSDDKIYAAAAEVRDAMLAKLTLREKLQLKLATGILDRLIAR
jgi:hypothetical protein